MSILQKLNRIKTQKIGKFPVVILPLDYFENIKEDMEKIFINAEPFI